MSKPNVLAVCAPDHYALRNLDGIRDLANFSATADPAAIERLAPQAEVIVYSTLTTDLPFAEIWRHAKNVRWIHSLSAGVEPMLLPEVVASPVTITNARGVYKRSLAEFVVLGMLYFGKRVRRLVESQRAHRWDKFPVEWLPNKIMGIAGFGEIGRECAALAKPLGVKIYAVRRKPELSANDPLVDCVFAPSEWKSMLRELDFLVAAAPLTPETRHMIGAEEFAAMKPSAVVMNVGRGPVIDEQALIQALREERLCGAALDVFENEPLPPDHPFWDMENVLVSPHNTDRTRDPDWLDLSMQAFVENFRRYVSGRPLEKVVDKRAGY
ncbi:MAG TPA: D-2-hydroxyacid dehydrogenase [Bryobacteraceae bacterium]